MYFDWAEKMLLFVLYSLTSRQKYICNEDRQIPVANQYIVLKSYPPYKLMSWLEPVTLSEKVQIFTLSAT